MMGTNGENKEGKKERQRDRREEKRKFFIMSFLYINMRYP
jgi:hypothetical protein